MSAFSNGLEAAVVGKYGGEVQYMAINFSQRISFTYRYSIIIMLELKKEIECPYNQLTVHDADPLRFQQSNKVLL